MSGVGIMILVLVIFVGIPGVLTGIYVIHSLWKERWFRDMLTRFLLEMLLVPGILLLGLGVFIAWDYSQAESNYLDIDLESVNGVVSDITYIRGKSGNHYCLVLEDGRSYILRDSPRGVFLDKEYWMGSVINRQFTLKVKKYNWLQGILDAPIFDRYDGEIYGVISEEGYEILDEETVRLAYYQSYHNTGELNQAKYFIVIGLMLLTAFILIKRKVKLCRM